MSGGVLLCTLHAKWWSATKHMRLFRRSASLVTAAFEPMSDLYTVPEGIIPVDRVTALFVPGNLRGIRAPVVFFPIEPFKDRRVQLGAMRKSMCGPLTARVLRSAT